MTAEDLTKLQSAHAAAVAELSNVQAQLSELTQAHYRLIEHTNETEQYLDEAALVLSEIVKSTLAYRECTDQSSPTGQRIASIIGYVAQFQPEPIPGDEEVVSTEWRMNPCNLGHLDVGAAGGIASCHKCNETVSASTTEEAFTRWNATHPAVAG